jgi:hypothetical protein
MRGWLAMQAAILVRTTVLPHLCIARAGSKRLRDIHQRLCFVPSLTIFTMLYCSRHHKG